MNQLSKAARSHRKYRDKEGGELSDGKRARISEIKGKYKDILMNHKNSKKFAVFRKPCLPEDEGRSFLVAVVSSIEEARDVIEREQETSHGYFKEGDYAIFEEYQDD